MVFSPSESSRGGAVLGGVWVAILRAWNMPSRLVRDNILVEGMRGSVGAPWLWHALPIEP